MYKLENNVQLTDKIKNAFKKGVTRAYLKYDNVEINPDNYLISVDFSDEKADPEDGRFIGKAICRSIDIKLNNKSSALNLENKELEYYLGALVDGEYVYIKFGNFIVQKPENQEVNEETTFTALDYMSKFDIKYIPTITFPNTIGNIAEDVCKQCGVELGNPNFRNADKVIDANPFINAEQCREVIKSIAKISFSCAYIWQDNKLYFGFEKNDDITETINIDNYFEMKKNNEIKPITIITLRSSEVEASGQSIRNAELIEQYGQNELIIEEDYFAFTDTLRQTFLQEASVLFGLSYNPIDIDLEGSVYLSFNDILEITNLKNETIRTYCFNNSHTYNGTLYNRVLVPALTETEEKYIYQDEDETKRTKTAIEIDKANAKITQVVEQVGEQNAKISQVTQTVDELNSKIGEVADVTITGESYNAQVFLEGINASEPILIKIRPYLQSISALYPSKSLFPGNGVYPRGKPKLIFFDRDNNNMWAYMLPDNLNYIDENTYDEFLLDYENQICSVTKRVGIDENGALYKLDIPYSTQYDYPTITLEDGNYNIYLDTYNNGYLFVKLMSANIYTSQFATKVELNSEIKQTKSEIDLSVSEKLTGYPTTTEMNSAINVKADEINLKVEKKVDEEELGTQITQNWESVQIAWNQISEFIKYINAEMHILDSDKNKLMALNKYGQYFYNMGVFLGKIGTNHLKDYPDVKSLNFDLGVNGKFMTWASQETEGGANLMRWTYTKAGLPVYDGKEGLHGGADIYTHGHKMIFNDYFDFSGGNYFNIKDYNQLAFYMTDGSILFDSDGGLSCSGNIYANNFTSDGRLKKDIKETEIDAKEIIYKIPIREFTWKKDNKNVKAGFIAQELEEIDENFVDKRPIYNEEKEIIDYQYYVNDRPILATLVKLAQDQQEEIDDLKKDIAILKEMLNVKSEKKEKKQKKEKETKQVRQYEGKILKTKFKKAKPTQFIEKRSKDGIIIERLEEK